MTRRLDDWLSSYLEFTENTEPPRSFNFWVGVSLIAAALSRKVYFNWGRYTFHPHMYIVLVAPAGKVRKGVAMKEGKKFLEELNINICAESITREALIRQLKDVTSSYIGADGLEYVYSALNVFSEEFVVFLGNNSNNTQMLSDLTDWWDASSSKSWTYRTKTQGTDMIEGLWLNLLGATTPDLLRTSLMRDAIGGGLTSRIIFVYEPNKKRACPITDLTEAEKALRDDLAYDLSCIQTISGGMRYTEDFIPAWTAWYLNADKNPPNLGKNLEPYLARRPAHVLKLCIIMAASNKNRQTGTELICTAEELHRAVNELELIEQKMPQTFAGVGKSSIVELIPQVLAYLSIVKSCSFGELVHKFYQDADKVTMGNVIATLKEAGAIKLETITTKNPNTNLLDTTYNIKFIKQLI